jgi:putative copper export protein
MPEAVASAPAEAGRRTSLIVTAAIGIAFVIVSIVFAANTQRYFVFKMLHVGAAVVWVGGGLFLTICAVLARRRRADVPDRVRHGRQAVQLSLGI